MIAHSGALQAATRSVKTLGDYWTQYVGRNNLQIYASAFIVLITMLYSTNPVPIMKAAVV